MAHRSPLAYPVALALLASLPSAARAQQPPTLDPDDYGRWESLGQARLSPGGRWLAWGVSRVDERSELRVRRLQAEEVTVIPNAERPVFTPDERWLAFTLTPSAEERERLEEDDEPVRLGAGLLALSETEPRTFPDVERWALDESGRFLALKGYAPEEPEGKGADLRVLDLATGEVQVFGNVSDLSWSERGSLLALAVATGASEGNAVQVFDAATGTLRTLDASGHAYRHPTWREDSADLAVLVSERAGDAGEGGYRLLAWRSANGASPERFELEPAGTAVPDSLAITEHRAPEWSADGRRISFGLRPAEDEAIEDESDDESGSEGDSQDGTEAGDREDGEEELAAVQIWHTSDVRIVPQQMAAREADRRRSLLAVWEPDAERVVTVGTDLRADAEVLGGWRHAVERTDRAHPWGAMFGRPYDDVGVLDLESGERSSAFERVRYSWQSAGGRYLLAFDGRDYLLHDLGDGATRNLTGGLDGRFADEEYDTPTDVLPPHGVAGWTTDDEALLVYDEFDLWRIDPAGSGGERLTRGREDEVVHRLVDLAPDEEAIDPERPLYLSLSGKWTKRTGYARLDPDGRVRRLLLEDLRVTGLAKADSVPVFLWRAEDFDDSPDWFVSGPEMTDARQVTATNPFQRDFAWGRSELVDFQSEAGRRLQAALLYPAGYQPGRRYPMIVYTYELLSGDVHEYVVPSERSYYNFTAWTQQGYAVLLPDIVYRARDPGVSALEAVRPAVARAVEMGVADPERVGLIGHSWGGYQATFLPTRTDIFAASVAGAPLTDFVSMMGAIHWNQGFPELSHWETGQARMEVPFWEDPEAHRRNSPVHEVHRLDTPLLMAFGDQDGTVDYDQGTQFYNFARRAGKQMVLLVYEGENHGFRDEANQKDYHRRILEWFGHYLKGEPAAAWITDGVPIEKVEDEVRRIGGG